jgi:hypothetical protein
VSDRVSFESNVQGSEEGAEAMARRYASGQEVAVHYYPDAPDVATLDTREPLGKALMAIAGCIVGLAAFLIPSIKPLALPAWAGGQAQRKVTFADEGTSASSARLQGRVWSLSVVTALLAALAYIAIKAASLPPAATEPDVSVLVAAAVAMLAVVYQNLAPRG